MASPAMIDELRSFGANSECVVEIGSSFDPRHLDYLDLPGLPARLPRVTAVVEMAGRAILYVVRGPLTKADLDATCHLLAQRGAADHLGVLEPGVLTVVPLLGTKQRRQPLRWAATDESARGRIPGLAFGINRDRAPGTALRLHNQLVTLLTQATQSIVEAGVEQPEDALSLVGRALFLRFLIDRRFITSQDLASICPGAASLVEMMETPSHIAATSRWLDSTFNGNLLPLNNEDSFWSHVKDKRRVCTELAKILLKTDASGQLSFNWATLDFSHIPVGLLSQVYEKWCHVFTREKAIQDSVWYTPKTIAEYVVDEAFYDLPKPHLTRVLDPAVGAGVFLVAAYREIVAAWWRVKGKRPDRELLRKILYTQLTGFDVNEASLRLTALALYLTALELDPDTSRNGQLRFEDLRTKGVLHDVRGPLDHSASLPMVGSLGPHISGKHKHAYDLVLGNPPWTAWTAKQSSDPEVHERRLVVEDGLTPFVSSISESKERFEMVDFAPDLPFCWRGLEWARPGGIVAFALHARLLFRQSEGGTRARNRLFGAARVTGILNGAALAQTKVWPSHEAPFCLWFATNERPHPTDGFHFVSPVVDRLLNSHGYVRIDAAAARLVSQAQVVEQPWLLKTLYRGNVLDASIIARLQSKFTSLGTYLEPFEISPSRGYVEGADRSPKRAAPHLHELPDLTGFSGKKPRVNVSKLEKFRPRKVNTPRSEETFRGPLVLLFEAPRHDRSKARALLSRQSVAYNHVFFGISTAAHPEKELLAEYLFILLNSSVSLYVALLISSQFGADRKRFDLRDLLAIPCPPLESLSKSRRGRITTLANEVEHSETFPEKMIDDFVGGLLGLSPWDLHVMRDTLDTALPFKPSADRAQRRPTHTEVEIFTQIVQEILADVIVNVDRAVCVTPQPSVEGEPWLTLTIDTWRHSKSRQPQDTPTNIAESLMQVALEQGASRIVVQTVVPGQLVIGVFAQYRYWTRTQARLLALDLLENPQHERWLLGEP